MAKSTRPTKKSATPKRDTRNGMPAHDAIARRAYEIYLSRGGNHGSDVEDWLQAEREVAARRRARR